MPTATGRRTRQSSHNRAHSLMSKSEEKRVYHHGHREKTATKTLSPYNLFVKKHMKKGVTMKEVANLWNSHKK